MRSTLFLSLAVLVSGCSVIGNLGQLESQNPQADTFNSALAAEYLAYSESESEQGHYFASEYFADKGLRALSGEDVAPEWVNNSLPKADRATMEASREQLLSLMTPDVKSAAPQKAARAQIMFDCLQQQDRRNAPETQREKAPCEDEFAAAMADLQDVADSFIVGEEKTYHIVFAHNSAALTKAAQHTIAVIAKEVSPAKTYAIQLEGRESPQDEALAKHRIDAVKQALIAHGVAAIHIHVQGAESHKAVRLSVDEPPVHPHEVEITVLTGEKAMMRRFAMLCLLLCTGCSTYSLQELRQTTPTGNAFEKDLAKHYLEFAEVDEQGYDWYNSMHFADKGLLAAYGQEIGPEELDDWNIPKDQKAELVVARDELLSSLTPGAMQSQPQAAADAQFYFDCWVQYQEAGWQTERIEDCRDNFHEALDQLGGGKTGAKNAAAGVDQSAYIVYFAWGQAVVTREAQRVIDQVVEELKAEDSYDITLNGHTDTTGTQEYNLKLSNKRALAVKARLVAAGIEESAIKTFAFGKSSPAVDSGDNVREPLNRRVEIFLDQ